MNILLTSAGFENIKIRDKFLECIRKEPCCIRALFIPTAAITADSIAMLPKCMNDLLNCGIPKENISVYDLHKEMSEDEINRFHAVYICGGSTKYLLSRINEVNFNVTLDKFIRQGGVMAGVSAGSIIAARNLPDNLGYLNCILHVHSENGSQAGSINISESPQIWLTDKQAILLTGINEGYIIE